MGRLSERLTTARRTLSTLVELPLAGGATLVERDAAIQRFEYSFEAFALYIYEDKRNYK